VVILLKAKRVKTSKFPLLRIALAQKNRSQWSRVVARPTAACEDPAGFESQPPRAVVFITTATAIYSLGHGLCTYTAMPIGRLSLLPSVGR